MLSIQSEEGLLQDLQSPSPKEPGQSQSTGLVVEEASQSRPSRGCSCLL